MQVRVVHQGKTGAERTLPETGDGEWVIGKSVEAATGILLPDAPFISRRHAVLRRRSGQWEITDESTNGTFHNNQRLVRGTAVVVREGDVLCFGTPDVQALLMATGASAEVSVSALLRRKPEIIIGRDADCDVVLSNGYVSHRHCSISREGPDYFIKDLGSRNGTFVNGTPIRKKTLLLPDDVVLVGTCRLSLQSDAVDIRQESAIRLIGLEQQYGNGNIGFHSLTLSMPAQSLTGIMGPSGCGKSTLLNTLTGTLPATRGSILIHGLDLRGHYAYLKHYIGYVPQYDIAHQELTVHQCLFYTAQIRLEQPDKEYIENRISRILAQLNISETAHQAIASLSGGQRKRVCIAIELMIDPLILFLDEPTSPLDPQSASELMRILEDLAQSGTTVVIVTHKPDDLYRLQQVLFLSKGGYPMYYGRPDGYMAHFKVRHAVQVYELLNNTKDARFEDLRKHYEQSVPDSGEIAAADRSRMPGKKFSPLKQLYWLTTRTLRIKLNDRATTAILLLQAPLIAALICLIFQHINLNVLFLLSLSAIWLGTNNAAREIVGEGPIYTRERMFNLGIGPYLVSKLLVFGLLALLQAGMFTAVILLRYRSTDPALENPAAILVILWGMTIAATVMGLLVSSLARNSEQVIGIIPLVLIPQILLAGTIARVKDMGVELLSYLVPARWGTEAVANVQPHVMQELLMPAADTGMQAGAPVKTEEVVAARSLLMQQYHPDYGAHKIFDSLTGTLTLDALAIGIFTLSIGIALVVVMKRKDAHL